MKEDGAFDKMVNFLFIGVLRASEGLKRNKGNEKKKIQKYCGLRGKLLRLLRNRYVDFIFYAVGIQIVIEI